MRLAIYKKVFGGPEVINLNGKMFRVQSGDHVAAPAQDMMGRRGFSFVRFVEDTPETLTSQPVPEMRGQTFDEQKVSVETMNAFEEVNIEEVVISEEEVSPKPKDEVPLEDSGFNQDIIDKLKSYNHRQWFTMKKNEIVKILVDAKINFSHIPDEKWELLKFLKSLINID